MTSSNSKNFTFMVALMVVVAFIFLYVVVSNAFNRSIVIDITAYENVEDKH